MHRVKDLIGVPFVEGGRDPKTGLDCLGLVIEAVKRLIPNAIIPFNYLDHDSTEEVLEQYNKHRPQWERIDVLEPGCVVTMKNDPKRPDLIQHLGIYVGDRYIMQCLKVRNVHLIKMDDPYWKNKIEGFYRWKSTP